MNRWTKPPLFSCCGDSSARPSAGTLASATSGLNVVSAVTNLAVTGDEGSCGLTPLARTSSRHEDPRYVVRGRHTDRQPGRLVRAGGAGPERGRRHRLRGHAAYPPAAAAPWDRETIGELS